MKNSSRRPANLGQVETIKVTSVSFVETDDKKNYHLMFIDGKDPNGTPLRCMVTCNNEQALDIAVFQGILPQLGIFKEIDDEPVIAALKKAKKPVPTGNKVFCGLIASEIMAVKNPTFQFKSEEREIEKKTLNGTEKKTVINTVFNPQQF